MAKTGKPSEPPKVADNKSAGDKAKNRRRRSTVTTITTTATSQRRSATAMVRMTNRFERVAGRLI